VAAYANDTKHHNCKLLVLFGQNADSGSYSMGGIAAMIVHLFAIGCGTNDDLPYSGAQNWLDGIPLADRGAVHYYATSFTDQPFVVPYDFCNLWTSLFLAR
jgi:hypothetical protein